MVALGRGVAQRVGHGKSRARDVLAPDVGDDGRVGLGLDAGDVDAPQSLYPRQDAAELLAKERPFPGRER